MISKVRTDLLRQMPGLQSHQLEQLSDNDVRDFTTLFAESRKRQRDSLNAAIDKSMRHVPVLLRGPLKRILFP